MNTEPVKYLCRNTVYEPFDHCSLETVCQKRGDLEFEFKVDKEDPEYFENWLERFDMMCMDKFDVNFVVSYFYIGYLIGIVTFIMPDSIGRKKTIILFFILSMSGHSLVLFCRNPIFKSVGFFLIGFAHIKNSCSFQYCSELFPKNKQQIAITVISFYDTCNIALICAYIKFVRPSTQEFLIINFGIALVAGLLFFLLAPESPKWFFSIDEQSP